MKIRILLRSLLFIFLLFGCGDNKTKVKGIDDLPGLWIFDISGTLFGQKLESQGPIVIAKNGDFITFETRNDCELVPSNDFTLVCKHNFLLSTDCNLEDSFIMQGTFSDNSIKGTLTTEDISAGYGCDVTNTVNDNIVFDFTGEKVGPHSGDYFKIKGKVSETEFDLDTNQVLCVGIKREPSFDETDYEFIIAGQNGSDTFDFEFDVTSMDKVITSNFNSFQTNNMTPGYIYDASDNSFCVMKYGDITKADFTLRNWTMYDSFSDYTSIDTAGALTGEMNLHCKMYLDNIVNPIIIN